LGKEKNEKKGHAAWESPATIKLQGDSDIRFGGI